MAGYSETPLVKKLGIKPGITVRLINPPAGYQKTLGELPDDVVLLSRLTKEISFIHLFAGKRSQLDSMLQKAKRALKKNGMLWVSWPKKSSGVVTDIDENYVRKQGLKAGLVDVKICAVDDTWSGLKFVFRLKDRKGKAKG